MTQLSEGLLAVMWNVIGGAVVAGLILAVQGICKKVRRRSFRMIFGKDVENVFYLVYPHYESPSREIEFRKPPSRVPRRTCSATNLSALHSTAATRTVNHLAYEIGSNSITPPRIISDVEADQLMDISFLAIGGHTNHKSVDIFDNEENKFLDFGHESIVSKESGDSIVMAESKVDYAIILKISPFGNPKRTWLCCSGFGEWGTSGAAWWLSHNWKSIYKKAKNRSFACITRTRVGSDDSTRMLHLFLSSEDVQRAAHNQNNRR